MEDRRLDLSQESLSVTSVAVTIVKPLQKTAHQETIDPTPNDLWLRDVHSPFVFAYRVGSGDTYEQLANQLKDSLQKVLVPFYPFAGRWIAPSSFGDERQLLCNDAGVPFIETYAHEDLDHFLPAADGIGGLGPFQMAHVAQLHAKSFEVLGMDYTHWKQEMREGGLPGLFIQVTRFKCGGVVVAPTFSHMLADATSFFHFLCAWSDIALTGQTAITPDFNRASAAVEGIMPPSHEKACVPGTSIAYPKKVFEVSKLGIESMKRDVMVETGGTQYVSTHDCVLAHIWHCLSTIRPPIAHVDEVVLVNTAEGRVRFFDRDHAPSRYVCGNVITMFSLKLPNRTAASTRAAKIREQLVTTRQQEWVSKSRLTALTTVFQEKRCAQWNNTSLMSCPVYEVNLGFGRPFFAFPASTARYTGDFWGKSIMYPPRPGNSKSAATLHLEISPAIIDALCNDKRFTSLFLKY